MAYAEDFRRTVVLKARRDTIVLVVTVTAVTFALASAIHSRPGQRASAPPQQAWTGELAGVPAATPSGGEPVTSASLVVPTAELALPPVSVRALVKLRGCDGGMCPAKVASVPVPVRRPSAELVASHRAVPRHAKPTLISRLNPLNHLPDMSTLGRPFAVAGDTVSGWLRRF